MKSVHDVLVVGAGIFGVTTALELNERHYNVAVIDPGPLPHPLAASTDISKVIRMEYGADEQYMAMVEAAIPRWRRWNEELGETLYHEVGVLMVTRAPLTPGSFEYESYHLLQKRGHDVERLGAEEIAMLFPVWKPGMYVDGFFHPVGGYAESGRVVQALITRAKRQGVTFYEGQTVRDVLEDKGRVRGMRTRSGDVVHAPRVVVAAGTWTHLLIPELAAMMRSVGQPVFLLKPKEPARFTPPAFPVFTADIANSGWYGFPIHPREGVLKIAHHGQGVRLHPENDERVVTADEEQRLRDFLAYTFPELLDAPVVYTRRCLYCDSLDEHFWIDRHPTCEGLTVAAGGSGHGFKFAPILGGLVADAVEGKANKWLPKFRWRALAPGTTGEEAARFRSRE